MRPGDTRPRGAVLLRILIVETTGETVGERVPADRHEIEPATLRKWTRRLEATCFQSPPIRDAISALAGALGRVGGGQPHKV